jgi:hypothetical protein
MANIPITVVRYDEKGGRAELERFIFGGMYGGPRVPRGVSPELVSEFVQEKLLPDSSPDAYQRTAEVIRFYERADVAPHLRLALAAREKDERDVRRSAFAIQGVADLGPPQDLTRVAQYFDSVLVPHAAVRDLFPLLLETLITLASVGSPDKLRQKLHAEVERAAQSQDSSEAAMMAFDKLSAVERNDLPRAVGAMDTRRRLLAVAPAQRRNELVLLYLGQSPHSTDLMETWAGRLLRREAMESDTEPVCAAFSRAIELADPAKLGEPRAGFIICRSAQAILYLGGKLTPRYRELYQQSKELGAMNFLWDDL